MATYTEKYNLKKPDETDFIDIADINENMDKIDDAVALNEQMITEIEKRQSLVPYAICNDNINNENITAEIIDGSFVLKKGVAVDVYFSHNCFFATPSNATLNVNNTGAKKIQIGDESIYNGAWQKKAVVRFVYNGTFWIAQLPQHASYSGKIGVVALQNYVDGRSDVAATPYCVKQVYNLAYEADKTANKAIPQSQIAKANGVASLDEEGKVPIEQISFEAFTGYTDSNVLGLYVDYENKRFTRLAGAVGKNAGTDFDGFAMYGGRKRCNVADNGTINAYYGDTNYTDDGTNGQVMVYQPKFYYKVVPLKLDKNVDTGIGYHIRKANYYVSDTPKAGFKLHPAFYDENGNEVDYILFSAYEGVLKKASDTGYYNDAQSTNPELNTEADLICSVSSQKPISGQNIALNITNAEKLCSNRGTGWHNETIKSLSANQLLMMIEYGALNMQAAIVQGFCRLSDVSGKNCACNTGATRTLGNATGNATSTFNITNGVQTTYHEDGYLSLSYRGVENPYGNIALMIEGINYTGDENGVNRVYIADDFNFDANKTDGNYHSPELTVANDYGYINAFGYDEKYDWLFMPSEIGGTSALPVGDRLAVVPNSTVNKIVLNGGIWNQATYCGAFQIDLQTNYNQAMRMNGCRLVYIPAAD